MKIIKLDKLFSLTVELSLEDAIGLKKMIGPTSHGERMDKGLTELESLAMSTIYNIVSDAIIGKEYES